MLVQSWNGAKSTANKFDEVNILVKKCDTFKESDKDVIGQTASDFIQLRKEVKEKIEGIDIKNVSRVSTLLEARSFFILKEHMKKLKENHGIDSITHEEAL